MIKAGVKREGGGEGELLKREWNEEEVMSADVVL